MTQDASFTPDPSSTRVRKGATPLALLRAAMYLLLAGAIGAAAFAGYQAMAARSTLAQTQTTVVTGMGLITPTEKHLASPYTDPTAQLVAAPPSDASALIDPDTLVVAFQEDADADAQQVDWKTLCQNLAKATGKKVISQHYDNSVQDVNDVKNGKIEIVALHAADTPYLVNNAGFVPFGVLGGTSGPTGNKLDIAVPASSSIRSLDDLRGHTLTCTIPSSITGYRAAVALLMLDTDLRPNVDYLINFSLGQKKSIKGLEKGQFEAAALSDDKVQSMIADGKLQAKDLRMLYQSEVIPRLTIGYVYNLKPQLADEIKQTVLSFDNKKGATNEDDNQPMKFAPVDYKKDFALVRRIDAAFDPRFNSAEAAKAKKQTAAAQPATAPAAT